MFIPITFGTLIGCYFVYQGMCLLNWLMAPPPGKKGPPKKKFAWEEDYNDQDSH